MINISSEVTTDAPPTLGLYSAIQAAIDNTTKTHAKQFGPHGIRVSASRPGVIATEGTTALGVIGSVTEKGIVAQMPLGRIGQPEDLAIPAVFLASRSAQQITRVSILVSGGAGPWAHHA